MSASDPNPGGVFLAVADAVRDGAWSAALALIIRHGEMDSSRSALEVLHALEAGGLLRVAAGPRTAGALREGLEGLRKSLAITLPRDGPERRAAELLLLDLETAVALGADKSEGPANGTTVEEPKPVVSSPRFDEAGFVLYTRAGTRRGYRIGGGEHEAREGRAYRWDGPGTPVTCSRVGFFDEDAAGSWKPPAEERLWEASLPCGEDLVFRRVLRAQPVPEPAPALGMPILEIVTVGGTLRFTDADLAGTRPIKARKRLRDILRAARRAILAASRTLAERDPGWGEE